MSLPNDSFSMADSCTSIEKTFLADTARVLNASNASDKTLMLGIENSFLDYYFELQAEGGFVAFSREFSGAVGQGETVEEALADLERAIALLKEVINEDNQASANRT